MDFQAAMRRYLDERKERHLDLLRQLVRQPSISSQGVGVEECAQLVRELMEEAGILSQVKQTAGSPIVVGQRAGSSPFTVLFYGHYDVQPPEPLELWHSPPFEPTVRDGRLYGRGTGDNKGQFLAHILAVAALLEVRGELPVSVKFIVEGEEESGSHNLPGFVEQHRDLLRADVAYTADGGMHPGGRPVICLGCRGLLYVEARTKGANADYHSGNRGGVLPTPAWELVHFLADLRDAEGRVRVPGFWDKVVPPTPDELRLLAEIPFDGREFNEKHGLTGAPVPNGVDHYRALMFEPTFNIAGLASGYGGVGAKTIVPHQAVAKLDMRLVPNQDPHEIFDGLQEWAAQRHPGVQLTNLWAWPPSYTPADMPVSREVIAAVGEAWGMPPVIWPRLGGSLPNFVFTQILGIPSLIVPYANHDENNHAPNENIRLDCFYQGIWTTITLLERLGKFAG